MEAKYIWMDGKMVPFKSAKIHVLNHSLHYGSAVFEGIRCYKTEKGPAVFRLDEHVERLFHSAKTMGMKIKYSEEEIFQAILDTVKKNKLENCYIRPLFFYGEKMGLSPIGAPVYCMIAAWEWNKYLAKDAVSVMTSSFTRIHHKSSVMSAKISGHYSNSIIASLEASKHGFDEALFLDSDGNIAEGPGENIFFIKGTEIHTPKVKTILAGITRNSITKIVKDLDFKVIEKDIKLKDIKKYDEAFFVGTAVEVNAIGKIDKVVFNNGKEGKAVKEIKDAYKKVIHGEVEKYEDWLSLVK